MKEREKRNKKVESSTNQLIHIGIGVLGTIEEAVETAASILDDNRQIEGMRADIIDPQSGKVAATVFPTPDSSDSRKTFGYSRKYADAWDRIKGSTVQ